MYNIIWSISDREIFSLLNVLMIVRSGHHTRPYAGVSNTRLWFTEHEFTWVVFSSAITRDSRPWEKTWLINGLSVALLFRLPQSERRWYRFEMLGIDRNEKKRRHFTLLHDNIEFRYHHENHGKIYWACKVPGCSGMLEEDNYKIKVVRDHNHVRTQEMEPSKVSHGHLPLPRRYIIWYLFSVVYLHL